MSSAFLVALLCRDTQGVGASLVGLSRVGAMFQQQLDGVELAALGSMVHRGFTALLRHIDRGSDE